MEMLLDVLSKAWVWVLGILSGASISGIIGAVIYLSLRNGFKKTIDNAGIKEAQKRAVELGIDKIKNISFSQSIQPIVVSELKKVNEHSNAYIKETCESMLEKQQQMIEIIEALSMYFNNSIGVPEEVIENLKSKIAKAKDVEVKIQEIKVEEPVKVIEPITEVKVTKKASR